MWVNVTRQLASVSHLDIEVRPSYLVSTSAVLKGVGLLTTRAYVGVNAHHSDQRGVKEGEIAASTLCNDSQLPVPYGAICVALKHLLQLASCDLASHVPRFR